MEKNVSLDISKTWKFVSEEELSNLKSTAELAKETLVKGTGAGSDFLGWVDLPVQYDQDEFARIKKAAEKIRNDSEVLVVVGRSWWW